MGIPKFFRWLTRRYPMVLQTVQQLEDIPPVDNLYLDLNGIVHNAIHGNDPKRHERISKLDDLEELWAAIMRSIDELIHVVKPKQMIFLAVDGVAPRAKMNQQRARRFKSAKERELLTNQLRAQGKNVPEMFDTNAISPGTEFMVNLCEQLHFFLKYKINTDPLYQNLKECIISDGNVPGEGEHKMLDYIRQARMRPDYNPNTRHCYYGADADLIMLSLLTHEPHFFIIREEHIVKKNKSGGVQRVELSMTNNFQLIHISLLREYFQLEYRHLSGKLRMKWDIERIIDDFIFFCFFIGNDFLPSISALDIAEGSLDQLIEFYKTILPNMDDYITHQGVINWERAEKFIWILGEHEHEVFKDRIDSNNSGRREREETRTISVTNETNPLANEQGRGNRQMQTFNLYKDQIYQKKVQKVAKLKSKNEAKKYKKYLVTKMFKEDDEKKNQLKKKEREELTDKFQQLYLKHKPEEEEAKGQPGLEGRKMHEVVQEIDQEYFSDLQAENIPDDCVSDIENTGNEQTLEETAQQSQKDSIMNAAADMVKQAEADNLRFMNDFIKLYAQDPQAAKATYYQAKVSIDITTEEGQVARKKMMKKYLEGIQWVLFYYYRGAQHWRWYYPYHYAPLISDLGYNIVKDFLGNNPFISKFEIDYNCPLESHPYTPFQQLLSIMPIRSFKLLPPCYRSVATGELSEYFPDDFSVDLNGKTLAWEAIVLIPFCDQKLFLEAEQRMIAAGSAHFTDKEIARNAWTFSYHDYTYLPSKEPKTLTSTLTGLKPLTYDNTQVKLIDEYASVGDNSFVSKLLPGCISPSPGYPSFKQLNIIDIEYENVVVRKVQFKKLLVKIPQCIEETQPESLEEYLWKLAKQANKEVFVDLPFLREAFPMFFEDQFSIYTLYGDVSSNQFTIQQAAQWRSQNEWEGLMKRIRYKLSERGIFCPQETTNVLVTCNKVQSILYSSEFDNHYFYKTYKEDCDILPLSLCVRRRDVSHYQNVDARVRSLEGDLKPKQQCVLLKMNLFGLMGQLDFIDMRKQLLKIKIDKQKEESKVHDPFMGQKHLKSLQLSKKDEIEKAKSYFGESDIDLMLGFKGGVVARLTSSFMITYKDLETKEKCLVDIGLNMKSWQKQMHVAGYVRFTQNADDAAINQYDGYQHNQFAHGAKHIRAHWEYSLATVEIVREYAAKFPQAIDFISKNIKKNTGMPHLKDMFGSNDQKAIGKMRELLQWIDSLPVSHLPFVDMGFDALTPEMIQSLSDHQQTVNKDFTPCNLLNKEFDWTKPSQVFVERFPFWASPFPDSRIEDFRVGTRVMNINSTRRDYIPFGLRGTVVGKTQKQVMVLFDEQFLQGTDINGHCENYRGAIIEPSNLVNLTKKFSKQLQKNAEIVQKFTEVDPKNPTPLLTEETQESNDLKPTHQAQGNQGKKDKQAHQAQKQTTHGLMASQKQANQSKREVGKGQPQKAYVAKQQPEAQAEFQHLAEARAKALKDDAAIMIPAEKKIVKEDPAIVVPVDNHVQDLTKELVKEEMPIFPTVEVQFSKKVETTIDTTKVKPDQEQSTGMPSLQFAPMKADLMPSAEFQQLMAEMKQPSTAEDLLKVFSSATAPSNSSSTS